MRNQYFYKPDERYLEWIENAKQKWLQAGNLTPREAEILDWYLLEKEAKGVSPIRRWKLCNHLLLIRRDQMTKPFHECGTDDILNTFVSIKSARRNPLKQEQKLVEMGLLDPKTFPLLKQNSVSDKQRILRTFCLWICKKKINPNLDKDTIQEMRPVATNNITIDKKDLLTSDELDLFFSCCHEIRELCIFHVMFEGGLRCADIGNLRWKDILITDTICRIKCDSKTGKMRTIPLPESKMYLTQYINIHPFRYTHKDDDLFFLNQFDKPLSQASISQLMKRIAARAGITKPIHPHLLRHTRITQLVDMGMREGHIKQLAWGNASTDMMKVYSHLNEDDLEAELARVSGYEPPESITKVKRERKPTVCPVCGEISPYKTKFCPKCYTPLNKNAEDEFQDAITILLQKLQQNPNALSAWVMQQQK